MKENINKKSEIDKETESFMAYMDEKEREEAELETCFPDIEEEEETVLPFECCDPDTGEYDEKRAIEYFNRTKTIEKKKITIDKDDNITIEKTTERTITKKNGEKKEDKKERIFLEGQKDLEDNDASNINFGGLVTRNVMIATYRILENYLVLFPKHGFVNEMSGMILYGPNGTGKTEFCAKIQMNSTFLKHCSFEKIDLYHLIDSEMGKTSLKVATNFKNWEKECLKSNKIQVKIIDEGEMAFLQRKDKSSKAYAELSNSMLKHTGKFDGVFIILITNNIKHLDKGALSRFERIFWPSLDEKERVQVLRYRLENLEKENPRIKFDMKNWDKIDVHIDSKFGDLRTINKFIGRLKGWLIRNWLTNHEKGTETVSSEEIISVIKDFKKEENNDDGVFSIPDDDFNYPSVEEMIDYCIDHSMPRYKSNYAKLKEDYKQFGLRGNQLEGFLKPGYRKIKERFINNIVKEK